MMGWVQSLLDWLSLHPNYAGAAVFVVAMGEALFIIGLVVPSTVVLVGAGTLVGLGKLPFWPVFLLTVIGATAGDAISYWFGHVYKSRIKSMWPFSHYPDAIAKGEAYMQRHGGKSVFIGRFVPGVKAVIPGIAGMTGMNPWRFTVINIVSAFAWAALHLFPSIFAGAALTLIGTISTRLMIAVAVLLLLLVLSIWGGLWLTRSAAPTFAALRAKLIARANGSHGPVWAWIASTFDPDHPRTAAMFVAIGVVTIAIPLFLLLWSEIGPGEQLVQSDVAIANLIASLRTTAFDRIMVVITMLGDRYVTTPVVFAVLIWLAWRRYWVELMGMAAAVGAAAAFVPLIKIASSRARPLASYDGLQVFSFPSGHATINAVLYSIVAYLLAYGQPRWAQSIIYSVFASLVLLIGLSRLYLGVHWPSDVGAGFSFGLAIASCFALFLGGNPRQAGSRGLMTTVLGIFLIAGSLHIYSGYAQETAKYARQNTAKTLSVADWNNAGWKSFPLRRIDLVGETEEPLVVQWSGTPQSIEKQLTGNGWQPALSLNLLTLGKMLEPKTDISQLPTLPTLHDGVSPSLIMTKRISPASRLVLRLWPTNSRVEVSSVDARIYVGSVAQEHFKPWLNLFLYPQVDEGFIPDPLLLKSLATSSAIVFAPNGSDGVATAHTKPWLITD
jgi:membrane protein DedA with SNARE-associated domain/membrane-associated phospholipid phosphatase